MELSSFLKSYLHPVIGVGLKTPPSLHDLCIRTAAIYATTSLYEFHDKAR